MGFLFFDRVSTISGSNITLYLGTPGPGPDILSGRGFERRESLRPNKGGVGEGVTLRDPDGSLSGRPEQRSRLEPSENPHPHQCLRPSSSRHDRTGLGSVPATGSPGPSVSSVYSETYSSKLDTDSLLQPFVESVSVNLKKTRKNF